MAKLLISDELWEIIEPLRSVKKRRFRHPGRKQIDNRKALAAILFVLRTGIPWEYLPQELGWGSGMTAWRRLEAWQKRGVWKKVHGSLLARLQGADKIDWSRVVVDSSSIRALHGGEKRVATAQIVGGKGANTALRPTRTAFRSWPR